MAKNKNKSRIVLTIDTRDVKIRKPIAKAGQIILSTKDKENKHKKKWLQEVYDES